MSENKNFHHLSTKERISVGLGAAAIGVLAAGGVSQANDIEHMNTSYSADIASFDQSPSQTSVQLEPVVSNNYIEQTVNQSPILEGKITIKKPISMINDAKSSIATIDIKSSMKIDNETQTNETKPSLHPETMIVPDKVEAIINRDSVYLDGLGCSGSIVRNRVGKPIGVVTAEHCGLRGSGEGSKVRITGSDGKEYIIISSQIEAKTGEDNSHLVTVGAIDEFYLPANDDTNIDVAFGAFNGHSSQEVEAAYNHNKLTKRELAKFHLGDRAYLSGWPVSQPNNLKNLKRQDFAMSFIGKQTITTASSKNGDVVTLSGESLNVMWFAVPKNSQDTECSWGNSGGKAFVFEGVHTRSIGVLGTYIDFTGKVPYTTDGKPWWTTAEANSNRESFEKDFNVTLNENEISGVCGIVTETPSTINHAEVVIPVSSALEIPGYIDSLKSKAMKEFLDPNYEKTILNGSINVSNDKTYNWKFRPEVFYDSNTGSAILASYNADSDNGVELDYIDSLLATPMFGAGNFIKTSGAFGVFNGKGSDGFIDQNGQIFGESYAKYTFPDLKDGKLIHYDKDTNTLFTTELVSTAAGT